jgi:cyclopropane fatty-acyl-phospholipid synthase-like methyltransferase
MIDKVPNELYDAFNMEDWRKIRLKIITDHYGYDYFRGKQVLEVGAAWGHIGAYFANVLGAKMTCTDHYDKWVERIKEKYPNIHTLVYNVNDKWPFGSFDAIINMGVIYHQPADKVEPSLRSMCQHCTDLIIETSVEKTHEKVIIPVDQPPAEHLWEPIATEFCLPSHRFIEDILVDCNMNYQRFEYLPQRTMWLAKKGDQI